MCWRLKAAVDRMAADCGIELKKHNVAMISLYPGAVKTELIQAFTKNFGNDDSKVENKEVDLFAFSQ